jgi:hypothetical protein
MMRNALHRVHTWLKIVLWCWWWNNWWELWLLSLINFSSIWNWASYFKVSYIILLLLCIHSLQENWPTPTAIFQIRGSFTYGHLITVTKGFLIYFIISLSLSHAFIVLSSPVLSHSLSALVLTHSPRFNLTHSRFHSQIQSSHSFSIESSKSFTLNPKSVFVLFRFTETLKVTLNLRSSVFFRFTETLKETVRSSDSHSLNFVFFFRFSHSLNFIVFFRFSSSVQASGSTFTELVFYPWLVIELIWFWIKIWMRSYFVVWTN